MRHLLRAIRACWREVRRLEWNCQTYGYNRLSRDGRDEAARVLLSRGQQLQANLSQLCKPVTLFWVRAPEELVRALLQDPELFELAYAIRHDRRQQDQWLSLESEQLIAGLSVDGLQGGGSLRQPGRKAQAGGGGATHGAGPGGQPAGPPAAGPARRRLARHPGRLGAEQETVAAILNAINGWRNELTRQRGRERRWDALDVSCHQGHLDRVTLETLMAAVASTRSWGDEPCAPWPAPSRSATSPLGSLCPGAGCGERPYQFRAGAGLGGRRLRRL